MPTYVIVRSGWQYELSEQRSPGDVVELMQTALQNRLVLSMVEVSHANAPDGRSLDCSGLIRVYDIEAVFSA